MQTTDTQGLAHELAAAMPGLDAEERRVALSLYRLLAEGEPVPPEHLAEIAGLPAEQVEELLDRWPGVYRDGGRVVGFWGLALGRMPHRLHMGGRELHAWCAWDTLFLPELLGQPATVESTCPATGATVSLVVAPGEGVRDVSPQGAALSFLRREQPFDADTIVSFCHFVHFFRDEQAARDWTARHEGTFVLSIEQGFEIGRATNRARFGAALAAPTAARRGP